MSDQTKASIALTFGIIAIGFAPIFVKVADTYGDVVGFYRMVIPAVVLAIPVWLRWRRGEVSIPRRGLLLGLAGGVAFAIDIGVWNEALRYTSASSATFLGNTAPLWVGLATWLILRERLHGSFWLGLMVALVGAFILVSQDGFDGSQQMIGNMMAFFVGIAYAAYQLFTARTRQYLDNLTYMWLFSAVGAVIFLGTTQAFGHPLTGLPRQSYLAMLGLSLITHLAGWLLVNYAFGKLKPTLVSISLLGQPVIATLLAAPLLGEIPTIGHVMGSLVILGGITLVHVSNARRERQEATA